MVLCLQSVSFVYLNITHKPYGHYGTQETSEYYERSKRVINCKFMILVLNLYFCNDYILFINETHLGKKPIF